MTTGEDRNKKGLKNGQYVQRLKATVSSRRSDTLTQNCEKKFLIVLHT